MADIIQFPQHNALLNVNVNDLLDRVEFLLADYSAEQIILALFEKATEADDIAALMPSFSVIVDKQD
jgi:hypothetical protein